MRNDIADIAVIGAGLAGMIAMLRFSRAGFSVIGVERGAAMAFDAGDLRTTALLNPSIEVLERGGIWQRLEHIGTKMEAMEIIDASQSPPRSLHFLASEIGEKLFGYNVVNANAHQIISEEIAASANIDMRTLASPIGLKQFSDHAELKLADGGRIEARLIIGADGKNSALRDLLGIKVSTRRYDQMAQVFTVSHELPHGNISTEIHDRGGPFTLVPRGDVDGKPASAIVWMDETEKAGARAQMPAAEFEREMNARALGVRGKMTRVSGVASFPMMWLEARRMRNHRAVLIGEAAHVVPPIGAQGLNMSLRDIEALCEYCLGGALDDPARLAKWERSRRADIALRRRGIDALNRISMGGGEIEEMARASSPDIRESKLVDAHSALPHEHIDGETGGGSAKGMHLRGLSGNDLRRFGLFALEYGGPLKKAAMRLGLGR